MALWALSFEFRDVEADNILPKGFTCQRSAGTANNLGLGYNNECANAETRKRLVQLILYELATAAPAFDVGVSLLKFLNFPG
jgi:hypothetical protein